MGKRANGQGAVYLRGDGRWEGQLRFAGRRPQIGLRADPARRVPVTIPFRTQHPLARWSSGPRCGLTDEFSAPCWSVRLIPTHGRLTPCGN